MSVASYGLTHLAVAVQDPARAFAFYEAVFGMVAVFRDENLIQAQTPGARDVLVFERSGNVVVTDTGGIAHFGFRLQNPATIGHAAALIIAAGGRIEEQGEFVPGEPYLFARDRDGYLIEVWYEIPTSVDPAL
ncbi:MAG: lactoylglutathione lyase [Gemmatimonadetes bacterium]|nr:lactoylglutathione lyase [Gemmatimonadota bacterium]